MAGLLASKLEMTRIVKGNDFVPVTLLKVPVLKIVAIKTEKTDGYTALVLGVLTDKKVDEKGVLLEEGKKSLNFSNFSVVKELPLLESEVEKYKVGDSVTIDILEGVETVEITGLSKGKGFAGAMKRHNFHGGPKSHGSKFHRALGSIGNRKPRRTHKGKKMHGHMGDETVTLKKINVEILNKELSVIGLKGPIPGGRNSLISIKF